MKRLLGFKHQYEFNIQLKMPTDEQQLASSTNSLKRKRESHKKSTDSVGIWTEFDFYHLFYFYFCFLCQFHNHSDGYTFFGYTFCSTVGRIINETWLLLCVTTKKTPKLGIDWINSIKDIEQIFRSFRNRIHRFYCVCVEKRALPRWAETCGYESVSSMCAELLF